MTYLLNSYVHTPIQKYIAVVQQNLQPFGEVTSSAATW